MDINETYARIGDYISSHQSQTYGEIGTTLGLNRATYPASPGCRA